MRSLIDLCEGSERGLGAQVEIMWWEQLVIDLVGAWEAAVETEEGYRG